MGSIWRNTHVALPQHNTSSEHTSGSMERYTWVRFAATNSPPATHAHMATVSTAVGRWRICGRRFKVQALTSCNTEIMRTRTTAGQFKCQFRGAMERFIICGFDWHKNSRCPAKTTELGVSNSVGQWNVTRVGSIRRNSLCPATTQHQSEHTSGAMDESSGKVQDVCTPILPSCHGYCSLQS